MFTVMFALGRSVGWTAHWREMIADPKLKIARPRQLYTVITSYSIHYTKLYDSPF